MPNRDPTRERPGARRRSRTPAGDAVQGTIGPTPAERLTGFRRLYRWLNLTLVQQGVWPLLVFVAGAPAVAVEATPWRWYAVRLAGPALAAVLALLYLAQRPTTAVGMAETGGSGRSDEAAHPLRTQARLLLLGLPILVAVARLAVGPVEPAARLLLFGLADVAAFQLIHFGVVARSYGAVDRAHGQAAAVLLFGASWGLRDGLLASVESGDASIALAVASGVILGLVVAALSRALRRWPGGWWPAAAAHWLMVYLVFGFVA